jgi:hypothetical protein
MPLFSLIPTIYYSLQFYAVISLDEVVGEASARLQSLQMPNGLLVKFCLSHLFQTTPLY